ncbi:MAG: hypothetical protein RR922_02980 [Clostridia bacterium]
MSGIIAYSIINEPAPRVIGTNAFTNVEETNSAKNPDLGPKVVEVKCEFKNKEEDDTSINNITASYSFPLVYLGGEPYTILNNQMESESRNLFATLKQPMVGNVKNKYKFTTTNKAYDCVLNKKQIVSVVVTEKMQELDTKENTYLKVKTYNTNVTTREKISSYEAAIELIGTDYKAIVSDTINAHLISREMKKAEDSKYVYSGLESWYVTADELHIMLNPGDVVDAKYGVIDIVIKKK